MEPLRFSTCDPQIKARADELLARMTLEEKVGQMVQVHLRWRPDVDDYIRRGQIGSLLGLTDVREINRVQRIAVQETRLGIPLIVGNDVIHGYRTIFPIPLAQSCTWNPELVEQAARIAADEAAANGTDWIFAPMVDIARDPRWGRIAEGAGEDPCVGQAMARAQVRGFQASDLSSGRRIVACPKHYVAYGAAEAGRDYNRVDMSEQTLRDVYLPPFKAAFDAGAGSVMSAFNEINGIPASANPFTLRTVLREEWGFEGVVLSDYNAVAELIPHGFVANLREAAEESVLGGVDMDMMGDAYLNHLVELVQSGVVPEAFVDEAVSRILCLKMALGLFERPFADESLAGQPILRPEHRQAALELAQQSMVLLKNEGGLLPLAPDTPRLAVIGPLADDHCAPLGCWSWTGRAEDVESVLDGLRAVWQGSGEPVHVAGCEVRGDDCSGLDAAVQAARAADVAVLVLGESADMSGEARSRTHLGLPGQQQRLLEAVCATGTPVVVVLMSGRPLVIPWMAHHVPAILAAWHGGIRTGRAVADILFGQINPSGRLTISWPRCEGQIPIYYAHKNTGRPVSGKGTTQFDEPFRSNYMDEPNEPLYPFGYGLSYTSFDYENLRVHMPILTERDDLVVSVEVVNSGARSGDEVVQLYVRDEVGCLTRPVKELEGFQRISLQPGERRTVEFRLPVSELGFHGPATLYMVEMGTFRVWVGRSSDEGLEGRFEVVA